MEHHEHETLILWFWFYRLCYFEKWYEEAEVKVKEMIIDELNEVYWEINTGLEYAKSIQHPKLEVIKKYNELISYVG